MMRRLCLQVVTILVLLTCFSGQVFAQADGDWYTALRFAYFPYSADIEGTAGNRNFDTEADLSDLMDNTETLLGGEVEFGNGTWFLSLAGFFQEVEVDKGNTTNGARLISSETAVNPMLGYRIYKQHMEGGKGATVDVMAGAYYVKLDMDLDIYSTALGNATIDRDIDFIDPMVGARGYYGFSKKVGVAGSGQIGGFGVGSELHYQLTANLIYHINQTFAVSAGWRHWYWDYEDDGDAFVSKLEQTLSGPTVGLQIKF